MLRDKLFLYSYCVGNKIENTRFPRVLPIKLMR